MAIASSIHTSCPRRGGSDAILGRCETCTTACRLSRGTSGGVSGVSENIKVSSSGQLGGGQLSVPGVTLVDFAGVEHIVVNGNNTPTSTETDTLTFAGTNAADTFNINLAAAGTAADPVLKLNNSATLLTLDNYTNFNTLKVLGLDGTDTFNVTTEDIGPRRNPAVAGG